MAYHYRGVVKYALKNVPEAIKDLKKAETLAETLDDELLRNKIYERLAYCNYWSSNSPLLLKYSQKLLHSSMKMNDSVMVARSYLMVASGFDAMGMKDSATVNLLQSLDWVDALNDSLGRNDILDNVAMMYQEAGDVEKAEQYLTDWVLKHSSRGRAYATLACIRQKQGKYEEAVSCAKKALGAADPFVHKQSLELLAELYSQMGDSSRAYAMQRRSKEFADSLASANKASQMADWQMKFDEQQMKEASDRKSRWLLWGVVVAVAVVQ
jgi:tetratricopeptide (TPR) repeat protein